MTRRLPANGRRAGNPAAHDAVAAQPERAAVGRHRGDTLGSSLGRSEMPDGAVVRRERLDVVLGLRLDGDPQDAEGVLEDPAQRGAGPRERIVGDVGALNARESGVGGEPGGAVASDRDPAHRRRGQAVRERRGPAGESDAVESPIPGSGSEPEIAIARLGERLD